MRDSEIFCDALWVEFIFTGIDAFLGVIRCFPVLALFLKLSETEEDRRSTDKFK